MTDPFDAAAAAGHQLEQQVADLTAQHTADQQTIAAQAAQIAQLEAQQPPTPPPPPTPQPRLVLGHYAGRGPAKSSWRQKVDAVVAQFGPFAGHMHSYAGVGSSGQLTADEKAWLDAGGRLLKNWKPWTSAGGWAGVGAGDRDAVIVAAAKTWAPYPGQLKVAVGHEPENDIGAAGSGMTAADYVAMWRHAGPLIGATAPGVHRVWNMMSQFSGHAALYPDLWPGADVVDVLGIDPYIKASAPATNLSRNIIAGANGLRALPGAGNLPVIVCEWGCDLGGRSTDRGTDQHRADGIDDVAAHLPDLIAAGVVELVFFDAGSDYFSTSGPDVAAYQRLKAATEAP